MSTDGKTFQWQWDLGEVSAVKRDPPTRSRQCPRHCTTPPDVCAAENRRVRAAEALRSPWEQAGTFLLQTAPWGLSYGPRQAKVCMSADSHVPVPEAQSRSSLRKAGGLYRGLWVRAEVGSARQLPAPTPEVSSRLLANSIQTEVLLLNEVTTAHLPAGLSSQRSPPSLCPHFSTGPAQG